MDSVRAIFQKAFNVLLPKQEIFYRLLEQQTASMRKAQPILLAIAEQQRLNPRWLENIRAIEDECDNRTRAVHEELQIQFITPIDREDIGRLTSDIDDIIDLVEEAVTLIVNYHLDFKHDPDKDLKRLLEISASSIEKVDEAIQLLDGFKDVSSLRNTMRDLEHAADRLLNEIEKQEHDIDVLKIVGEKEDDVMTAGDIAKVIRILLRQRKRASIARRLEDAVDKCKDVFIVLGNLYLKHT